MLIGGVLLGIAVATAIPWVSHHLTSTEAVTMAAAHILPGSVTVAVGKTQYVFQTGWFPMLCVIVPDGNGVTLTIWARVWQYNKMDELTKALKKQLIGLTPLALAIRSITFARGLSSGS